MYLPAPAQVPTAESMARFMAQARAARPDLVLTDERLEARWIGLDADSTLQIFELIRSGDKRGTFTLPWIVERTNSSVPAVGQLLMLVDIEGRPVLLTRVTRVDQAIFGHVLPEHTAIDGSPVRDPAVWVPLHTAYWNQHLSPFGLEVTEDMPFWIEEFELLYDAGNPR